VNLHGFLVCVGTDDSRGVESQSDIEQLAQQLHAQTIENFQFSDTLVGPSFEDVARLEERVSEVMHRAGIAGSSTIAESAARRAIRDEAADKILQADRHGPHWRCPSRMVPPREDHLAKLVTNLYENLVGENLGDRLSALDRVFPDWYSRVSLDEGDTLYLAERHFRRLIKDLTFGYGPVEGLLAAPGVSEIMIVPPCRVYIDAGGVLMDTLWRFPSEAAVINIANRLASRVGRRIDRSSPMVDARLLDGSRVNIVMPPIAVRGTAITIRKFPVRMTMPELLVRRTVPPGMDEFLHAAVEADLNIVVSGGTGTGKTSLVNALSDFIPSGDRVIVIEDTAELQLGVSHLVRLEARAPNAEGVGAILHRDLIRNALRMRPDRIILGEVRGPEALDMLKAMNTGHDGCVTTVHANSPLDAIRRLEVLALESNEVSPEAIREHIGSAVNMIIQLVRDVRGRRKVTAITEVLGTHASGEVRTRDLFAFDPESERLRPTGSVPAFCARLENAGLAAGHRVDLFSGAQ
jgi:pilus assembly protein CpaF